MSQAVLIAKRTLRQYQTLWAQYQTILRMAQGLGNMEQYRIPAIAQRLTMSAAGSMGGRGFRG